MCGFWVEVGRVRGLAGWLFDGLLSEQRPTIRSPPPQASPSRRPSLPPRRSPGPAQARGGGQPTPKPRAARPTCCSTAPNSHAGFLASRPPPGILVPAYRLIAGRTNLRVSCPMAWHALRPSDVCRTHPLAKDRASHASGRPFCLSAEVPSVGSPLPPPPFAAHDRARGPLPLPIHSACIALDVALTCPSLNQQALHRYTASAVPGRHSRNARTTATLPPPLKLRLSFLWPPALSRHPPARSAALPPRAGADRAGSSGGSGQRARC